MLPDFVRRKVVIPLYNRIYEADRRRYFETQEAGERMRKTYEADPVTKAQTAYMVKAIGGLRPRPKSILEVGCGYGRMLKALHDTGLYERLTGLEFSRTQTAEAARYLPESVAVWEADITKEKMPFPSNSFDLVFTAGVLMHIPPKLFMPALANCINMSYRWLMHSEELTTGFPKYGHDVAGTYKRLGYAVRELKGYPLGEGQRAQFLIVNKGSVKP